MVYMFLRIIHLGSFHVQLPFLFATVDVGEL